MREPLRTILGVLSLCCGLVSYHTTPPPVTYKFQVAKHHNYLETLEAMEAVANTCYEVVSLYSIGQSVEGRELVVLEFADPPGDFGYPAPHQPLKPEFKYIGNIHGNEVVSKELILALADHLCKEFKKGDKKIKDLILTTQIHLLPTMNPDGYEKASKSEGKEGKNNANNKDLNADFPELDNLHFFYKMMGIDAMMDHLWRAAPVEEHEPETMAVGDWILQRPFVLSGSFQTATKKGGWKDKIAITWPFALSEVNRSKEDGKQVTYDERVFKSLSKSYKLKEERGKCKEKSLLDNLFDAIGLDNPFLFLGGKGMALKGRFLGGKEKAKAPKGFDSGPLPKGLRTMQDFNYQASNCFELTMKLSCQGFPPASLLPALWEDNKASLLSFLAQVHVGVKGLVRDDSGGTIWEAMIYVKNVTQKGQSDIMKHAVLTSLDGDYFRLLTPGDYEIMAKKAGYEPAVIKVTVPKGTAVSAVRRDFVLPKTIPDPTTQATTATLPNADGMGGATPPAYPDPGQR